jgi:hypothetical protein
VPAVLAVLGGLSLLSVIGAVPLEVLAPEGASPSGASNVVTIVAWLIFGLSFTAVGFVVARREPRNAMGWLLLVTSLSFQLGSDAPGYAYLDYHSHHGGLPLGPVAVLLSGGWVSGFLAVPLIILLFPDGRPGVGWRWPLRAYLAVIAVFTAATQVLAVTDLGLRAPVDGSGNLIGLNHPSGWFGPFFYVGFVSCFVMCVVSVVAQLLRYRRARGERRQQVKWLGAAAAICVVFLLTTTLWSDAPGIFGDLLFPLGLTSLPVGIVDRRFNRARYDAEATVAAFTARLRDAVEIDIIRADLLDAVSRAVQPTHASIWIKP